MREARNHETVRWQRFEVVHFFDVAVADFTPGFVTLPNEAGIAGGLVSLCLLYTSDAADE